MLDVRDPDAIAALAAELGEVDIVFSNATSRMSPDDDPADQVDAVAETNNLATTAVLRAFAPRMRPGGRLIIVASALGTLDKLDERVRPRFVDAPASLDAVDELVAEWRAAVHDRARRGGGLRHVAEHPVEGRPGRRGPRHRPRAPRGRPRAGQAHRRAVPRPDRHRRVAAVVRGHEQRPDARAGRRLARRARRRRRFDPAFYGELVQFGRVLPWATGMPVPHRATA